jgi:hypothetical protein
MKNTDRAEKQTGEGNAPRETIQEREYKRLYLNASSQRDELAAFIVRSHTLEMLPENIKTIVERL